MLLPGVSILERFVAEVRSRMESRLWRLLGRDVTDVQRRRLDDLLTPAEGSRQSWLDRLRKGPVRVSGPALVAALLRIETVRFVHIDIQYLPRMPDETTRRYLFVAIDRATRWVYMRIYKDQTEARNVDFLRRLSQAAPMKIVKVLTDNGSQFTDRFITRSTLPSGQHAFDQRCSTLGIEHRLCPPRPPQTNGRVERFNGRIAQVIQQTHFTSAHELESTLGQYVATYHQHILSAT